MGGSKQNKKGDHLFLKDGSKLKILSTELYVRDEEVYNFEVKDNHNYFVSDQAILVHNNCDFIRKLFANNINDIETFLHN